MPFKPGNTLGRSSKSSQAGRLLNLPSDANKRVERSWPKSLARSFELVQELLEKPEKFQEKVTEDDKGRPHLCPLFNKRVDAALKLVLKRVPDPARPEPEGDEAQKPGLPEALIIALIQNRGQNMPLPPQPKTLPQSKTINMEAEPTTPPTMPKKGKSAPKMSGVLERLVSASKSQSKSSSGSSGTP